MYYYNNITTAIINCTFINNFGVTGGATISSYSSNLHIYNSTFISNLGDFGGAIETESGRNFSLLLCNFTANEATVRGGAISIYSRFVYIESNNFFYYSGEVGGAIHMRHGVSFIITHCKFKDNFGYNAGVLGVFSLGFTSIVTFSSNQANFNGGAINVMTAFPLGFTITNCTFVNNSAKHSGGALEVYSSRLEIYGSIFLQNSAKISGGAISGKCREHDNYSIVSLNITDSDFINNRANIGAALSICFVREKLTISKLTFLNNTAEQRGGAIDLKFLNIRRITFVIQTCNFINNQVTNELGKDGALAFEKIYGLKINSSKFIHNKAGYGGAAFFL